MRDTKTKVYREFLQERLAKGMMKTDAAFELAKEYGVSSTYAQSLVYRFFSGEYNDNRRLDGSRKRKVGEHTSTGTKKHKKTASKQTAITDDMDF